MLLDPLMVSAMNGDSFAADAGPTKNSSVGKATPE
jgi:hypothetical protein